MGGKGGADAHALTCTLSDFFTKILLHYCKYLSPHTSKRNSAAVFTTIKALSFHIKATISHISVPTELKAISNRTENPEALKDKAIRIRMDATHLMYQSIVPVGVTLVVISNL